MGTDPVTSQQTVQRDDRATSRRKQVIEYAGMLDRRTEAALFDAIFVHFSIFILAFLYGMVVEGNQFSGYLLGIFAASYIAPGLLLLYHIVLEGVYGQTLGKYFRDIAVKTEDGAAIGIPQSLIRNLLRIVDGLPALYIVGLISGYLSDSNQRLGDRAASTVVVRID